MRQKFFITLLLLVVALSTINAKEESSFGHAFNPIRLFALGSMQLLSVAGTFSYFDKKKGVEVAIPYFYQQDFTENNNDSFDLNGNKYQEIRDILLTADIQYRKYLTKDTQGLYYGGLLRYTYLKGESKYFYYTNNTNKVATQHKLGVGVVTGFRFQKQIENLDFYWGMNISFGGYLNKEVDIIASDFGVIFGEDGRLFIDVEILKFGVEF